MAVVKAVNVVAIRKMFEKEKKTDAQKFMEKLSPKSVELYKSVISTQWVSSEDEEEIIVTAAKLLFPNDPKPLIQIGRTLAKKNMTGVYQIFIKIPTIPFIIKRAASIWGSFYKDGTAQVVDEKKNSLTLQITDLPDIAGYQTETACGFMLELLDMTGAKNGTVTYNGSDPKAIKWHLSWD